MSCNTGSALRHMATPGIDMVRRPLSAVATSAFSSPSVSRTVLLWPLRSGTCAGAPGLGPPCLLELTAEYLPPSPGTSARTFKEAICPSMVRPGMTRPAAPARLHHRRPSRSATKKPGTREQASAPHQSAILLASAARPCRGKVPYCRRRISLSVRPRCCSAWRWGQVFYDEFQQAWRPEPWGAGACATA